MLFISMEDLLQKDNSSWESYSRLVLKKLDEHEDVLKDISKELTNIRIDIGMLKVKSGLWGLVGGLIPITINIILNYLKTN